MRTTLIPPPLWFALFAAGMWILHRVVPLAQWLVPPWNRGGAVLLALGLAFAVNAVHRFRMARTTLNPLDPGKAATLVTHGSFGISRNPMYLSLTLMLSGWAVWLGSASPFVAVPIFVVLLTYLQIVPEERVLSRLFGEQYAAYAQRVRRWI